MKNQKTKSTLKALFKAAVAMVIFVLAVINYEKLKNIDVRALVEASANLWIAIATIWGIFLVKAIMFIIPASLIYISVGMVFSPVEAIAINLVGIIIEVTVTYFLGRFLGGDYVNNLLSKSKGGRKILDLEINNRFSILLGIRALPVFPIDFVSLFWGASKGSFVKYFVASAVGIMPRVALFTVLGDGIYDYIPIHLIIKLVIIAIPIGVVVYLVKHFISLKKEETNAAEKSE
ncbi:MAG: TVP38/TMEM64 family protein [Clostridia bacterium]|nr:TVP38/TMEM64 family protein [Clostridia bacterium]